MKRLLTVLLVGGGLVLGSCSWAQTAVVTAQPAVVVVHKDRHEHHPEIHAALRKLRGAKENLEKAAHDYAGHRVQAIEAINHAIHELEEALKSDKD